MTIQFTMIRDIPMEIKSSSGKKKKRKVRVSIFQQSTMMDQIPNLVCQTTHSTVFSATPFLMFCKENEILT